MKWNKIGTIAGKNGDNGKDGVTPDIGAIAEMVLARVPIPKDGKDATVDVEAIAERVAKLVPRPKDGENGKDAEPIDVQRVIAEVLRQVPTPKDGTSVTLEQAIPHLEAGVSKWMLEWERRAQDALAKAIDRLPTPKDGRAGDRGEKGDAGAAGVGIERLVVDQKSVEFILTDGTTALVEMPVGPQGDKGADGSPGLRGEKGDAPSMADVEAVVTRLLPDLLHKEIEAAMQRHMDYIVAKTAALVPAGRDGPPGAPGRPGARGEDGIDGKNGINGIDGFGIEDFDVTLKDDGRTLVVKLANETQEVTKEIRLDIPVYQGVYKTGEYQRGDSVTYGGSVWIAKRGTNDSPPSDSWQLAVKAGRDAK